MKTERMMDRKRLYRIFSISLVLMSSSALTFNTATRGNSDMAKGDGHISKSTKVKRLKTTDVEIRLEFNPTGTFADLTEYYSVFIVIKQNGDARALRYGLHYQTKNIAAYEGVLPEADIKRLFARVRAAFRLPKYRREYDRHRVYHGDGFYLALMSDQGNVKEMLGNLETRPEDVRGLVPEMSELWQKLSEVPPAYAYVTSRPIEKDRLRALRRQGPSRLTLIESLPSNLQSLLISVVTQTLDFYPLPKDQYDQMQRYMRPMTYKGKGYELSLFLSVDEAAPLQKTKE